MAKRPVRAGDLPNPEYPAWTEAQIELIWDDPALLGFYIGKDLLVTHCGDMSPRHLGKDIEPGLHSEWIKHLWLPSIQNKDSALMAHRGSFKTTDLSEVGVIWNWTLKPWNHQDDRVMLTRGTFTAASSSMETIARNMKHPCIVSLFETLYGPGCTETVYSREKEILYKFKRTNTKEGSITAWGILQDFTGFHCDRVLGDDFVTRESQYSAVTRAKTCSAVNEIQTNIVDKTGSCHWIGTPWHKEDAWTCIPDPIKYAHRAWTNPDTKEEIKGTNLLTDQEYDNAIWGTRKDGKRYRKISVSQEAANYKLDPTVADEGALFANLAAMEPWKMGVRTAPVYAHVDSAFGGKDWTALTLFQLLPDNRIQWTAFTWPEHVDKVKMQIVEKCKLYRVSEFTTERNADKGYVLQSFVKLFKESGLAIRIRRDPKNKDLLGYHEDQNKHVKITTFLLEFWPRLVTDTDIQDESLTMVTGYKEGEEPDDPPDSLASGLREFYSTKPGKQKSSLSFFLPR